jgi:hypothetical protein
MASGGGAIANDHIGRGTTRGIEERIDGGVGAGEAAIGNITVTETTGSTVDRK